MTAPPALEVIQVKAGYGTAHVLFDVDLCVEAGQGVALLGRNGMGKTTLVKTILGFTTLLSGRIQVAGRDVSGLPSHRIAQAGVGWVPEGRQIFSDLSVDENLLVTSRGGKGGRWTMKQVYDLFPKLSERRRHFGNQLSGGEQQMLAIGRALMTQPALLVLDEATEGLAPLVRLEIWRTIETLKREGQSVLVIDRDLDQLARVTDRYFILERGVVNGSGEAAELLTHRADIERRLGV